MAIDEINFIDLACLLKITPDTVLEKFGSLINSSFFDASNLAGTLKQKGLIDFTSDYPGPNGIVITEAGNALIAEANAKAPEPFDGLDQAVLDQMSGGKRSPDELGATLNLRPRDLAMRVYKLNKQGYVIYDLRNGIAEVMLTEAGFLKVKSQPQQGASADAQQAVQSNAASSATADHAASAKTQGSGAASSKVEAKWKLAIAAAVIVIALLALASMNVIQL
jgi:hypothetical protein